MLYATKNTLFINTNSLRLFKVPVEICKMEPCPPIDKYNRSVINSPRISLRSGKTIYFSNDQVAWSYVSNRNVNDEINFLEGFGLIWNRDIAGIFISKGKWFWMFEKVKWIRIKEENKKFATLEVISKFLYNGHTIKVINNGEKHGEKYERKSKS